MIIREIKPDWFFAHDRAARKAFFGRSLEEIQIKARNNCITSSLTPAPAGDKRYVLFTPGEGLMVFDNHEQCAELSEFYAACELTFIPMTATKDLDNGFGGDFVSLVDPAEIEEGEVGYCTLDLDIQDHAAMYSRLLTEWPFTISVTGWRQ